MKGGGAKVYVTGPVHVIKMAAMPIKRKQTLNFFFRTRKPMILKLDMKYRGIDFYKTVY